MSQKSDSSWIISRDNPRSKRLVKLLSSRKWREREQTFVAEGARLCEELVRANRPIDELYLTEQALSRYPEETKRLKDHARESFLITEDLAGKISGTETTQGILATSPFQDHTKQRFQPHLGGQYLLLDTLQDPGNVGAILRTADAFGIDGVWLYNSADIYSPKVLRATMGGLFRVPVILEEDLSAATERLRNIGIPVYAAALADHAVPVSSSIFLDGGAILIGNEGAGLSSERISQTSGAVIIPMLGEAESLNASVAAGIFLWEMAKAKEQAGKTEEKE